MSFARFPLPFSSLSVALLQMLTLGVGIAVLLLSLLITYFLSSKAELLFAPAQESPGTAY